MTQNVVSPGKRLSALERSIYPAVVGSSWLMTLLNTSPPSLVPVRLASQGAGRALRPVSPFQSIDSVWCVMELGSLTLPTLSGVFKTVSAIWSSSQLHRKWGVTSPFLPKRLLAFERDGIASADYFES